MKKLFKRVLLVCTICLTILPISVYASESKELEKDFTIEVSKEEIVKDNAYTIDVVEDNKDSKKSNTTEKHDSEQRIVKGDNGITKDEMKELLEVYSKSGSLGLATPQSRARGTLIENVGADNKSYPIRRDISSKSTTSTSDTSKNTTAQSKEREGWTDGRRKINLIY